MNEIKNWDKITERTARFYLCPALEEYRCWEIKRIFNKWLQGSLSVAVKTDVFEEAFGTIGLIDQLAVRYKKILGIDISFQVMRRCQEKEKYAKILWLVNDISHMSLRNSSIDLVFSTNTYGLLDDVLAGLKEAYRVLSPAGVLIISIRNRLNKCAQIGGYLKKLPFPVSRAYYSNDFRALLKESGFSVVGVEPIIHIPVGCNLILGILEKKRGRVPAFMRNIIIRAIKKYSQADISTKHFTAWNIVFKAVKPLSAVFSK